MKTLLRRLAGWLVKQLIRLAHNEAQKAVMVGHGPCLRCVGRENPRASGFRIKEKTNG